MTIERVRVPLGVIGIIYESRPNVTADAGALALKAGNAVILRGGSDSLPLEPRDPRGAGQGTARGRPAGGRDSAGADARPRRGRHDAAGPRRRHRRDRAARRQEIWSRACRPRRGVPVFAHLEGVCHVYVDKGAPLDMAKTIVLNAKMRRTGVCGAAETLLVDRAAAATHLKPLVGMLIDAGCEVRGDAGRAEQRIERVKPASEEDWSTEYLDAIITASVVDGVDAAIDHIERYGSHHTDAIVTADRQAAEKFLSEVDSGDRAAQRLDAIRRRRRVRLRRRDRHRHRPPARARPGRRRAAHHLQVPRARLGADQAVTSFLRHSGARRRREPGIQRHAQSAQLDAAPAASGHPGMTRAAHLAAACAGHADRPVRRHLRSTACRALGREPAGDEAPASRPHLVACDARQSAKGHPRPATPGAAHRRKHARWRAIRASTSPVSKLSSRRATPTTRWIIWCAAARACVSSGSWARTTCGAFTAGKTGAASQGCSPWR